MFDGLRTRTQTQGLPDNAARDRGGLFTSQNQSNIIDLGEEINQSRSVALCLWWLNLTAFVLLRHSPPLHHPIPHAPWVIFGALLIRPSFPSNKRVARRETSWNLPMSSQRSHPQCCYHNHPRPRRCSSLIKLRLIHTAHSVCVFVCLCRHSRRYTDIRDDLLFLKMIIVSTVSNYRITQITGEMAIMLSLKSWNVECCL